MVKSGKLSVKKSGKKRRKGGRRQGVIATKEETEKAERLDL